MRSNQEVMIEKQAEIIGKLNTQVAGLKQEIASLNYDVIRTARPAKYYMQLQKALLENPDLQPEWDRFLILLKLKDCDISGRNTA